MLSIFKLFSILIVLFLASNVMALTRIVNSTSNNATTIGTLPYWLLNADDGDIIDCSPIAGQSMTLTSSLPAITKSYTIHGAGLTINGANNYQAFQVASGTVVIQNINVQQALSNGGNGGSGYSGGGGGVGGGGALYIHRGTTVTLTAASLLNNIARGGDGGSANNNGNAGGGGGGGGVGGMGGDGGFGAGGGGAVTGGTGGGGFNAGGGNGGSDPNGNGGGGGGSGLGGAIYIQSDSTLTIVNAEQISNNTAVAGIGGSSTNVTDPNYIAASDGIAIGHDIFIREQGNIIFNLNNTLTLATPIEGDQTNGPNTNGGLQKIGHGILNLHGANTYSGNTVIDEGSLHLNGSMIGNMRINSGGTLSGNATVSGNLANFGMIHIDINSSGNNSLGSVDISLAAYVPRLVPERWSQNMSITF